MQSFARRHIPNKIYFLGPPGVGKTTLVEELQTRQPQLSIPNELKHTRKSRPLVFPEDRSRFEYHSLDAGGEGDIFHRGYLAVRDDPPLAIVFVIDHGNSQLAQQRLESLLGFLNDNKKERPHQAITRGMMLFINKFDIWGKRISPRDIVKPLRDEINQIRQLGIYTIIRWGSAKYYQRFQLLLDNAIADFNSILISPKPTTPEWPKD